MIKYLKKPHNENDLKKILNPIVSKWFFNKFKNFSLPQLYAVMEIYNRNNILLSAPTGATKTLTGFLSILNELITLDERDKLEDKVYAIYVSPLKALNNDIGKNLKEPLAEMRKIHKNNIRVGVRTGDTSQSEKSKMLRKPPHILITTPESLGIVLTSIKFKEKLKDIQWFILDEIHALAENKRGTHLSLSIERLQEMANYDFTRIGLSATISPLEEIAKYLVGYENNKLRDCKIIDVQFIKDMNLKVLSPVEDLINSSYHDMHKATYDLIDGLIQEHKTTVIFTNTRSATERVVHHLKDRFPKKYTENIGAHHGSLSKSTRHNIEERLRQGKLKCVVTSTSLELGIDIGYIDLVILLGSPKSVARGLQRIGRSGHKLHETAKARIIPFDRDDLVENSVLLKSAIEKKIDNIHIPKNALDVLAQQIYGIAISDVIHIDDLFKLIKQSYVYHNLKREDFKDVIKYLSGEYSSLEDRSVYAKIWHDKDTGMIGKRGKLARVLYMTNIGTIPDESFITVKVKDRIVGKIDEGFLERLRKGDVFVLGGEKYEFLYSRGMTAQVNDSVRRQPTIPNWVSEMLPLSFDLAMEISEFRRKMQDLFEKKSSKKKILKFIDDYLYLDEKGIMAVYNYFNEQFLYTGKIPNDKKILVENYFDEEKDKHYGIFHTLFGRRVNDVLSRALSFIVGRIEHIDVEMGITDNGFYLASDEEITGKKALEKLNLEDLDEIMKTAIEKTEVLKRRFRHCASRALMILRIYKGRRKRVGRQQVSSMILLSAVRRIGDDFSILKEARREVLEDLMDIENAKKIIKGIENKEIKIEKIKTKIPSPFAFNIALQSKVDVFKISDRAEFLRKMHQQILEKIKRKQKE